MMDHYYTFLYSQILKGNKYFDNEIAPEEMQDGIKRYTDQAKKIDLALSPFVNEYVENTILSNIVKAA